MTIDAEPAISSRASFIAALQWGFARAFTQRARSIACTDPDFADWPFEDAALLDSLGGWLRLPQRRLVLLARDFDAVPRRLPLFNGWRARYSHAIEGWLAPADLALDLPTLLVADRAHSVRLVDGVHWRGRASTDVALAVQCAEQIDVVLQRSERAFAVNTLGL